MKVLVVEDERILAEGITDHLVKEGFVCEVVHTYAAAAQKIGLYKYDCIIVDINLPDGIGFDLIDALKRARSTAGIIVISARDAVEDKIRSLDLGSDDYLTKPFHLSELEARVRALIRRANAGASSEIVHGRLRLDMVGRRLYCDGQPLDLSARELAVIELLLLREGKVVTKQKIVDHLYGWDEASSSNTIEVFVYRLRKKLEASGVDIRTVRGMGYMIERTDAA